jgi:hypothetical protein
MDSRRDAEPQRKEHSKTVATEWFHLGGPLLRAMTGIVLEKDENENAQALAQPSP